MVIIISLSSNLCRSNQVRSNSRKKGLFKVKQFHLKNKSKSRKQGLRIQHQLIQMWNHKQNIIRHDAQMRIVSTTTKSKILVILKENLSASRLNPQLAHKKLRLLPSRETIKLRKCKIIPRKFEKFMPMIITASSNVQCKWVTMQIYKTCEEKVRGMIMPMDHFCTKTKRIET